MNYNSWRKKYPLKPFPYKLEKFDSFRELFRDLWAIQIQDAMMKAHQTAISNYGTTVFFGNTYTLSPTTISTSQRYSTENLIFKYIT